MIRFENVSYQYQDTKETKQLTDIELTIPQGHFLLVTGKSGCGKSTLAQFINGLIQRMDRQLRDNRAIH